MMIKKKRRRRRRRRRRRGGWRSFAPARRIFPSVLIKAFPPPHHIYKQGGGYAARLLAEGLARQGPVLPCGLAGATGDEQASKIHRGS
jgi:hypothetical protein